MYGVSSCVVLAQRSPPHSPPLALKYDRLVVVIAQSYAKEIREGCVRGYALSVKRWFVQAEKYAKTHGQVQLRHSNASSLKDGVSGDGSVEDGGPTGGTGEGGDAKKGNRLKMSGRVVRSVCTVLPPFCCGRSNLDVIHSVGCFFFVFYETSAVM